MRLDKYITDKGLCESRTRAEKLVLSGMVKIDGEIRKKPSFDVEDNIEHTVIGKNAYEVNQIFYVLLPENNWLNAIIL